ncbi:MAG: 6-carboxytetrahydropterin synthase QueD [Elusimicrobia bacterium]|nr:6-carboxytetrahydropterin synthase QueD [Elusimicrobiota bacterium]
MFEIFIEDVFSAAHKLRNYHGKCEHLHGHNYMVRVYVSGEKLDKTGILFDFTILKKQLRRTILKLDHKYLNEIKPFDKINPSAENIAKYIYEKLRNNTNRAEYSLNKVSVWETEKNCATYYENETR